MGMSVTEFLTRKNEFFKKLVGEDINLVPPELIKEVPKVRLGLASDADFCPYCKVFYDISKKEHDRCKGCPLDTAKDNCMLGYDAGYDNICEVLEYKFGSNALLSYMDEELIKEYNKQFD